jgi:hypothetical protein
MANSYKDLKKKDESEVSDRLTVKLGDIAKFRKLNGRTPLVRIAITKL